MFLSRSRPWLDGKFSPHFFSTDNYILVICSVQNFQLTILHQLHAFKAPLSPPIWLSIPPLRIVLLLRRTFQQFIQITKPEMNHLLASVLLAASPFHPNYSRNSILLLLTKWRETYDINSRTQLHCNAPFIDTDAFSTLLTRDRGLVGFVIALTPLCCALMGWRGAGGGGAAEM